MAYARGDVVLVPFPFNDRSTTRVRPAVVVSSGRYNRGTDIIIAMITSRRHTSATDCRLDDWQRAGLVQPSWARAKLATLKQTLVQYSPGRLSRRDWAAVEHRVRVALGL